MHARVFLIGAEINLASTHEGPPMTTTFASTSVEVAKILIVEDHPLMCQALTKLVSQEKSMEVCGTASGVEEARDLAETTNPDVALVDISLRDGSGIELVKLLKSSMPALGILVVSAFEESLFAERALRAGARGYINKRERREAIVRAIHDVIEGNCYLSAEMTSRMLEQSVGRDENQRVGIDNLTERELEVFQMIGNGLTTHAIAERMNLSVHTVNSHRENIRRKLGVTNSLEMLQRAVQWVLENK